MEEKKGDPLTSQNLLGWKLRAICPVHRAAHPFKL